MTTCIMSYIDDDDPRLEYMDEDAILWENAYIVDLPDEKSNCKNQPEE